MHSDKESSSETKRAILRRTSTFFYLIQKNYEARKLETKVNAVENSLPHAVRETALVSITGQRRTCYHATFIQSEQSGFMGVKFEKEVIEVILAELSGSGCDQC